MRGEKSSNRMDDEKKYHSKIGTPAMIIVWIVIILARYFEIFTLSCYLVIPIAIFAGVIVAASISTIIFSIRGY